MREASVFLFVRDASKTHGYVSEWVSESCLCLARCAVTVCSEPAERLKNEVREERRKKTKTT